MTAELLKKKILIVDDDPDVHVLLGKRLESKGFQCISSYTVEEALQKIKEIHADLIILDLRFGSTDGTAFLKTAKQWLPQGKKLPPVLVLSGYDDQDVVDYMLDLGAVGYITKPFDSEKLISTIQTHIHTPSDGPC